MKTVGALDLLASRFASRILRWNVARTSAAPRTKPPPQHDLILYDFEGSPWCRLVREYATILDLTLCIKPCPRESLFYGEGLYGPKSRFRPEAMEWYNRKKTNPECNEINTTTPAGMFDFGKNITDEGVKEHLTFPLLIDRTKARKSGSKFDVDDEEGILIFTESYEILCHLWEAYGESVLSSSTCKKRPDQLLNDPRIPFPIRFLSLAGPSYMRPWPQSGLMRFPSRNHTPSKRITLYQAEGCPESRLVREALCSLEVPYTSVPVTDGSWNICPSSIPRYTTVVGSRDTGIPTLEISENSSASISRTTTNDNLIINGANDCVDYLKESYYDKDQAATNPTWFDAFPENDLGDNANSRISLGLGAYTAFRKGTRAFVPERALE